MPNLIIKELSTGSVPLFYGIYGWTAAHFIRTFLILILMHAFGHAQAENAKKSKRKNVK